MDSEERHDLIVILAGLAGIAFGQLMRRIRAGDASPEDRYAAIGASTLVATPALARIAGDALDVDRSNTGAQAALSFVVGAVLTAFADEIGRFLPVGRIGRRPRED